MTILNTETGELIELDQVAARRLTDKIKVGVEGVWHLIEEAYTSRAWAALGYSSWDDYCTREFGTSRLRLPREDRPEVVASLRESGLSLRAIASATGYSEPTVRRSLAGASNDAPAPHAAEAEDAEESAPRANDPVSAETITGTDGKTYPAARTGRLNPRPAAEISLNSISSLADRAARETQKLTADQIRRVKPNATEWIGGIRRSVETLQGLLAALEQKD